MKRVWAVTVALTAALSCAACSAGTSNSAAANQGETTEEQRDETEKSEDREQENISVVTGPVGGSMYVISGAWADLVNKNSSYIQVTNQVGGGSA